MDQAQIEHSEINSVIVASESEMLSLQVSPAAVDADELCLPGAAAVHEKTGHRQMPGMIHYD